MLIRKEAGTYRTAILLPGFVIKFCFHPFAWFRLPIILLRAFLTGYRINGFRGGLGLIRSNMELHFMYFQRGFEQSRIEHEINRACRGQPWFTPVIFFLGPLLVQRHCAALNNEGGVGKQLAEAVSRLYGSTDGLAHTFHTVNLGILDGQVVLLDYGAEPLLYLGKTHPDELAAIFREATVLYHAALAQNTQRPTPAPRD